MKFIRYQSVAINVEQIASLNVYDNSMSIISSDTGINPINLTTTNIDASIAIMKEVIDWIHFTDTPLLDLTDYK